METIKNQHFIPKFILKNGISGNDSTLLAVNLDMQKNENFMNGLFKRSNVKKIASMKYYHECKHIENKRNYLEILINNNIENKISLIFDEKLLSSGKKIRFSYEEELLIKKFVGLQIFRAPFFKNFIINNKFHNKLNTCLDNYCCIGIITLTVICNLKSEYSNRIILTDLIKVSCKDLGISLENHVIYVIGSYIESLFLRKYLWIKISNNINRNFVIGSTHGNFFIVDNHNLFFIPVNKKQVLVFDWSSDEQIKDVQDYIKNNDGLNLLFNNTLKNNMTQNVSSQIVVSSSKVIQAINLQSLRFTKAHIVDSFLVIYSSINYKVFELFNKEIKINNVVTRKSLLSIALELEILLENDIG